MNYEPDIQRIKREILERAIDRYEMRIEELKSQLNQQGVSAQM